MNFPLSTGQAARLLGTSEPKLAEEVRRKRIDPPPAIFAGRRLWQPEHLLKAARNLGLVTSELRETLSQEVSNVS